MYVLCLRRELVSVIAACFVAAGWLAWIIVDVVIRRRRETRASIYKQLGEVFQDALSIPEDEQGGAFGPDAKPGERPRRVTLWDLPAWVRWQEGRSKVQATGVYRASRAVDPARIKLPKSGTAMIPAPVVQTEEP